MLHRGTFSSFVRVTLAACGPSLLTLVLAAAVWQAGPRSFVPLWNDEVVYWNETAAFIRAGFDGGYITVNEKPAAAAYSRFGPHGPAFAVLYGSIGRIAGWRPHSGYVINLSIVAICAAVWLLAAWRGRTPWSVVLLVLTFWPMLFYLPSNMQDPLHFGLAFLFAALVERGIGGRAGAAAALAVLAVACLTRPTWALLIPALAWGRDGSVRRRAWSVPLAIVVLFAAFIVVTRAAAPYPYTSWITAAVAAPATAPPLLAGATAAGLRAFTRPHPEWFITLFRIQVIAGLAAAVAGWWMARQTAHGWRLVVAMLAVLPMQALMFPIGDIESGRDFHLVAPHLLFALLVVAPGPRLWAIAPAVLNLVLVPTVLPAFYRLHDGRFEGTSQIRAFADGVRDRIVFDERAPTGWANTVLMHADSLQPALAGLPFGIGVSYVLDWEDLPVPPRSRYLLLRPRDESHVLPRVSATKIAETPLGAVYRNDAPRTTF